MTVESADGEGGSAQVTDGEAPDPGDTIELESISLDVAFDILSNSRRRLVLSRLKEVGGEATTGELAEYIAAIENGKPQSELTSQERKRVYVGIYQTHLPKMDDADVVDVDDRGAVTLGPNADEVFALLDSPEESSKWPTYYGVVTGLSAVALLGAWLFIEALVGVVFGLALVVYAAVVGAHARSVGGDE